MKIDVNATLGQITQILNSFDDVMNNYLEYYMKSISSLTENVSNQKVDDTAVENNKKVTEEFRKRCGHTKS